MWLVSIDNKANHLVLSSGFSDACCGIRHWSAILGWGAPHSKPAHTSRAYLSRPWRLSDMMFNSRSEPSRKLPRSFSWGIYGVRLAFMTQLPAEDRPLLCLSLHVRKLIILETYRLDKHSDQPAAVIISKYNAVYKRSRQVFEFCTLSDSTTAHGISPPWTKLWTRYGVDCITHHDVESAEQFNTIMDIAHSVYAFDQWEERVASVDPTKTWDPNTPRKPADERAAEIAPFAQNSLKSEWVSSHHSVRRVWRYIFFVKVMKAAVRRRVVIRLQKIRSGSGRSTWFSFLSFKPGAP